MSKFVKVNARDNGDCICINLDYIVLIDEFTNMVIVNTAERNYKKIWLKSESIKKIISELGV